MTPRVLKSEVDSMETFEQFDSVWNAIEDDPREAARLTILSDLMIQILRIVKENVWDSGEAAKHFRVTPEKLDDVLAGRIDRLKPGELFEMVASLGGRVRVEIEAA